MTVMRSLIFFGIPTLVLYAATNWVMPVLTGQLGMRSILAWFLAGGVLVFIPMFTAAIAACRREDEKMDFAGLKERLRLKPMTPKDWRWAVGTLMFVGTASGLIMLGFQWLSTIFAWIHPLNPSPPFMHFEGLEPGEGWIIGVWLCFFFFNIVGEEIWWRGYIMPRQEEKMGNRARVVHGVLWTLFHICFGLDLVIMLLPLLFVLPYVVWKRKNTWIGIFVHGVYNGMGFLVIALKLA
ncbi:MAG: CPBP family intramembrane metalloprotease [bacterium]|nr:CPBP family intramembrane metalloprotease [bacterium]